MLCKFGKIFLWGVRFNIIYNELVYENINNFKNLFFSQSSETINKFKQIEVHATALCHNTHCDTYSYQVGPFKFRLLVGALHNCRFIFAG